MAKRYYFTNENGDNIGNDHIGNIRGAKTVAKRLANELNCEVCINDCETEDMIDFVYPDRTETVESVEVAEETTVPETETVETEGEPTTDAENNKTIKECQTICNRCNVEGAAKSLALEKCDKRNDSRAPPEIS